MEKNEAIKRLLRGLLLWIVSAVLKYALFVINIVVTPVYYFISLKWKSGAVALGDWFYFNALANDQSGNVQSAVTFNFLFSKRGAHKYGNEDDTISYVLARNKYKGKLSILGRWLGALLDLIDKDHLKKSIDSKIASDQEAINRIQENKYFE